jgi:predicted transcriptional regulator
MVTYHGSLESEIMNAVWSLEELSIDNKFSISVSDVLGFINANSSPTAYTTVKTVMDRLVEKEVLAKEKNGKKFYYRSTNSRTESAKSAIKSLVGQYFNNDIKSFMKVLESECLTN